MRRIVGGIILTTILLSCSFSASSSTLEAEAKREADKIWMTLISKCGGSYYVTQAGDIFEMKTVTYSVSITRPSPADKMNGIQGKSMHQMNCKLNRWYNSYTKTWSNWRNGGGPFMPWFMLVKRNGKWLVSSKPNQRTGVDCAKIPSVGD